MSVGRESIRRAANAGAGKTVKKPVVSTKEAEKPETISVTEEKKKIHKVISVILCFLYGITGAILIMFSYKIGVILLYTLILISFLVIIATFQELERRWRYEKGEE